MFSKRSSKRSNQSRGSNGGVEVPLRDRTNATSTASSSFLPELNSTPPMPTFQKPVERYPSVPKRARPASGNWAELADVSNLLDTPGQHHVVVGYGAYDRPPFDTPELPKVWTSQHDRAICVLDSRNFDLPSIVRKMREVFPALTTYILTQSMVDKRLRQLDQDVYIDYWRVGLRASEASQPSHPLMTAHRQPGMGSSATLTGPTLMPPFEENKPVKEPKVKKKSSHSFLGPRMRARRSSPVLGRTSTTSLVPDNVNNSAVELPGNVVMPQTMRFNNGYRSRTNLRAQVAEHAEPFYNAI